MEDIADIKPPIDKVDISFYIYWGIIVFISFLVILVLFFIIRKILQNRKENKTKLYLEALENLDIQNSKEFAYKATLYTRLLATDERKKELFSQLEPLLEKYKYKKEVTSIDEETLNKFNLFLQVANGKI